MQRLRQPTEHIQEWIRMARSRYDFPIHYTTDPLPNATYQIQLPGMYAKILFQSDVDYEEALSALEEIVRDKEVIQITVSAALLEKRLTHQGEMYSYIIFMDIEEVPKINITKRKIRKPPVAIQLMRKNGMR